MAAIEQLIEQWEDARERGEDLDPAVLADGDPLIEQELREIIAKLQRVDCLMMETVGMPEHGPVEGLPGVRAGDQIGPYRLIRRIGEGGFGVVFEAEQLSPIRRRVAVKLIKAGMDTDEVIRRFESERQALALMEHPNIARVLQAGIAPTGRSYFVMEFADGIPIHQYIEKRRPHLAERLRLFRQIGEAIAHAHQRGIIHRDIKPSNILIVIQNGQPQVKVIDFGIAKAIGGNRLGDRTLQTVEGRQLGTPQYMSPEQFSGLPGDVDTRTDIYSLGVVLYEMLTGELPVPAKAIRHAIARGERYPETEPPLPSLCTRAASLPDSRSFFGIRLRSGVWGQTDSAGSHGTAGPDSQPEIEVTTIDAYGRTSAGRHAAGMFGRATDCQPDATRGEPVITTPTGETRRPGGGAGTKTRDREEADARAQTTSIIGSPSRSLRGDLDWITMRALERQPDRRYATVAAMLEDLDRYERGEPVAAGPPTLRYRMGKFIRRRRRPLAAAAVTVLVFLVMLTIYVVSIQREKAATSRALVRAVSAEQDARDAADAERLARRSAELLLAKNLSVLADGNLNPENIRTAIDQYEQAGRLFRGLGRTDARSEFGLWQAMRYSPPPLVRLSAHDNPVTALAYSLGGGRMISGDTTGRVLIWSMTPPAVAHDFQGHEGSVHGLVAMSGDRALSYGADGWCRVWATETGQELGAWFAHPGGVNAVSLVAGIDRIATAGEDGLIKLWVLSERRLIHTWAWHNQPATAVALSPDGAQIYAGYRDGALESRWVADGAVLASGETSGINLSGPVMRLGFSHRGSRLYYLTPNFGLKLKATERPLWTPPTAFGTNLCMLENDSRMAVSHPGRSISIGPFQVSETGRPWRVLDRPMRLRFDSEVEVRSMAELVGHRLLAVGGEDGMIRIWPTHTDAEVPQIHHSAMPIQTRVSPRTGMGISTTSFSMYVWDATTRVILANWRYWPQYRWADWMPDGRRLIAGRAHEDETGSLIMARFDGEQLDEAITARAIFSLAVAPAGDRAVVVDTGGEVTLWSTEPLAPLQVLHRLSRPQQPIFSGDGRFFLLHRGDQPVTVWSMQSLEPVASIAARSAAFTADPEWLVIYQQGRIYRWNRRTDERSEAFENPLVGSMVSVTPDNRMVALLASGGPALWELDTGHFVGRFSGHVAATRHLAADAGQTLLTTAVERDPRVLFWDLDRPAKYRALMPQGYEAARHLMSRPDDAEALATLAAWCLFRGVDTWATALFEKARLHGADPTALALIGVYERQGEFGKAAAEVERVVAEGLLLPEAGALMTERYRGVHRHEGLPWPEGAEVVDLLSQVEVVQDTLRGHWHWMGSSLVCGDAMYQVLRLPQRPAERYRMKLEFQWAAETAPNAAVLQIPVRDRRVELHVAGWPNFGFRSGLHTIDGESADDNPSTIRGFTMLRNRRHVLDVEVQEQGDEVRILSHLDGEPFVVWQGLIGHLEPDSLEQHAGDFAIQGHSRIRWIAIEYLPEP